MRWGWDWDMIIITMGWDGEDWTSLTRLITDSTHHWLAIWTWPLNNGNLIEWGFVTAHGIPWHNCGTSSGFMGYFMLCPSAVRATQLSCQRCNWHRVHTLGYTKRTVLGMIHVLSEGFPGWFLQIHHKFPGFVSLSPEGPQSVPNLPNTNVTCWIWPTSNTQNRHRLWQWFQSAHVGPLFSNNSLTPKSNQKQSIWDTMWRAKSCRGGVAELVPTCLDSNVLNQFECTQRLNIIDI